MILVHYVLTLNSWVSVKSGAEIGLYNENQGLLLYDHLISNAQRTRVKISQLLTFQPFLGALRSSLSLSLSLTCQILYLSISPHSRPASNTHIQYTVSKAVPYA